MLKELEKPVTYLKGVGPKKGSLYEKLGIKTVMDLLFHFPNRYIDFTSPVPFDAAPLGEPCVVRGRLVRKLPSANLRRGLTVYKAVMTDDKTDWVIVIYNNSYLFESLCVDKDYCIYGKISGNMLRKEISSPVIISADSSELVQPVYGLTEGLTQNVLRMNIRTALDIFNKEIYDPLPKEISAEDGMCSFAYAMENIHFPKDMHCCEAARKRLAYDELLVLSLGLLTVKHQEKSKSGCKMPNVAIDEFCKNLPFELTDGQKQAIAECTSDMIKDCPMNRLLQGDVGSGKTVVAAACAYFAFKNGCQTALMAPTEILAAQHFETLKGFLEPLGVKVVLLTGSMSAREKREIKEGLESGEFSVAAGTHALIQQSTEFNRLGLVITDEQHRFGVQQRAALAGKGDNPHKLVMSATPIPRTLALIMYGDLDISVLKELPKGRQPVETFGVTGKLRERAFGYVRKFLSEGRQGYVVCPMIDESNSELANVMSYAEELGKGEFHDFRVGLLHGRMSGEEKEQTMADFKAHKIDLLVCTTVVEVGVDVPNAAVIVIENADRFGLSQLHQLRGRVGRGKYKSCCILITDNPTEDVRKRIKTFCSTNDGFKISEEDLKIRGAGDFFGSRQHGLPKLKIADMSVDFEIMRTAQARAKKILAGDPLLKKPENRELKKNVNRLFENGFSDN